MKLQTTINRLEVLIAKMETVKPERFYLPQWFVSRRAYSCGYAACAFGWACYTPYFKKMGLKMLKYHGIKRPVVIRNGKVVETDLLAAQQIFGIDEGLAHRLFVPHNCDEGYLLDNATSEEWIAHAKAIVADLKTQLPPKIKRQPRSSPLVRKLLKPLIPPPLPSTPGNLLPERLADMASCEAK